MLGFTKMACWNSSLVIEKDLLFYIIEWGGGDFILHYLIRDSLGLLQSFVFQVVEKNRFCQR